MSPWRGILTGTLITGVRVTTNRADYAAVPPDRGVESIDDQARRKGVRAIESADDLAQDGVFDTDEELDAFLAHVSAMRHADLGLRGLPRTRGPQPAHPVAAILRR